MSQPTRPFLSALGGLVIVAFAGDLYAAEDAIPQLELGESHRGEITSSSELNGNDGSRYERHHVTLEGEQLVEFSLSGALLGRLSLFDPHGQLVGNPGQDTTLRRRIDESGDYLLVVSGNDASSYGPFVLSSQPLDLALGEAAALTGESRVDGWLQGAANEHPLLIEEAGLYEITLSSDDFDAFLELEGPNALHHENDDGAGNLNSRLSLFLERGDYRVTARSLYEEVGTEGLYRLEVASRTLDQTLQNDGDLPIGEALFGFNEGSPREYRLTLEEDAIVTLNLRSDDFDTVLEVEGQGRHLEDDDGGDGTNSRLRQRLSAGEYTVTARGYGSSETGLFELETDLSATAEPTHDGPLPFDEPIQAWLDPGVRDEYVVQIEEAGDYRLDMISEELDAYLELEGEGVSLNDDDGGNGFNARIQTHLERGEYRATARSFSSQDTGPYSLTLSLVAE